MDLAALWICGGENGTNGCHLGVFSVNVAFARHSMAIHPPSQVLAMPVHNLSKWQVIQLAIHPIVGE